MVDVGSLTTTAQESELATFARVDHEVRGRGAVGGEGRRERGVGWDCWRGGEEGEGGGVGLLEGRGGGRVRRGGGYGRCEGGRIGQHSGKGRAERPGQDKGPGAGV
jgi:hypothetical protein